MCRAFLAGPEQQQRRKGTFRLRRETPLGDQRQLLAALRKRIGQASSITLCAIGSSAALSQCSPVCRFRQASRLIPPTRAPACVPTALAAVAPKPHAESGLRSDQLFVSQPPILRQQRSKYSLRPRISNWDFITVRNFHIMRACRPSVSRRIFQFHRHQRSARPLRTYIHCWSGSAWPVSRASVQFALKLLF